MLLQYAFPQHNTKLRSLVKNTCDLESHNLVNTFLTSYYDLTSRMHHLFSNNQQLSLKRVNVMSKHVGQSCDFELHIATKYNSENAGQGRRLGHHAYI